MSIRVAGYRYETIEVYALRATPGRSVEQEFRMVREVDDYGAIRIRVAAETLAALRSGRESNASPISAVLKLFHDPAPTNDWSYYAIPIDLALVDGDIEVPGVPVGSYGVKWELRGAAKADVEGLVSIEVAMDQTPTIEFRLQQMGALDVSVRTPNGAAYEGPLVVEAHHAGSGMVMTRFAHGPYQLSGLAYGAYTVRVRATGSASEKTTLELLTNERVAIEFDLVETAAQGRDR